MDIARWVLSEAWIANGLRIRWARNYEQNQAPKETFGDGGAAFWYGSDGEWIFLRPEPWRTPFYGEVTVPSMSMEDMRHELAHWLTATPEQRGQVNFGGGEEIEERAVAAERVLSGVIAAAARIAAMAMTPGEAGR